MDVHSKVFFYDCHGAVTEIRRIRHPHAEFCQFPAAYAAVCGLLGSEALRLEYTDQEGDRVVVSSQEEWDEALRSGPFGVTTPLRLHLTPVREDAQISSATPAAIQCGDQYSGLDLPVPVAEGQRSTFLPAASADTSPAALQPPTEGQLFHEDWNELESRLSYRALELMADGNNADALRLLQEAHTVRPCKGNAYNMGCCLALLGRPEKALAALEVAIALGYNNFRHMQTDEDLMSLRDDPRFRVLAGGTTAGSPVSDAEAAGGSSASANHVAAEDADRQVDFDFIVLEANAPAANADVPHGVSTAAAVAYTAPEGDVIADQEPAAEPEAAALLVELEASIRSNSGIRADSPELQDFHALAAEVEIKVAQEECLYKLHELGFTSDRDNRRALEAANWNVRQALELLL